MGERVKNERAAVFREEVHFRQLQIPIFSTGVVWVHMSTWYSRLIIRVCFLVLHPGATLYVSLYVSFAEGAHVIIM